MITLDPRKRSQTSRPPWGARVLMLGWEFPPYISGGLGTACYGLTTAMGRLGIQVVFCMPRINVPRGAASFDVTLSGSPRVILIDIPDNLLAYDCYGNPWLAGSAMTDAGRRRESQVRDARYGPGTDEIVNAYAEGAVRQAPKEKDTFVVIHAHDWMTFPAGMALAAHTGRPLIVQVHSTEFDRSGEHVNQYVYDIERQGMHAAARVITVSNYTRNIVINRYSVPPEKVEVRWRKSGGNLNWLVDSKIFSRYPSCEKGY